MNGNLNEAIFDIGKVDAIMCAIEANYLVFDVKDEELDRLRQGEYLFYALWDEIKKVASDLDRISDDFKVLDVVQAVRDSRKREITLKIED